MEEGEGQEVGEREGRKEEESMEEEPAAKVNYLVYTAVYIFLLESLT